MTNHKKKTAILISGRGTNMRSLIKAAKCENFPAKISLVISNKSDAFGLKIAKRFGISTKCICSKEHNTQEAYDKKLDEILKQSNIEIVCLAGFMKIMSAWFVEKWYGRLINIHPALLPAFKGLNTHKRALEKGVIGHGCTVHFVSAELDSGPKIAHAGVLVYGSDDENTLATRVLNTEHKIYPLALAKLASKNFSIPCYKDNTNKNQTETLPLFISALKRDIYDFFD